MNDLIQKVVNYFKQLFKPSTDYKTLFEQKTAEAQHWEFKYNKLLREVSEAIENSK